MVDADIFYQELRLALKDLPGETAHLQMFPKRKGAKSIRDAGQNFKKAGVFILLHHSENQFWITLTQRHNYKGAHGGQVSFPGGKAEKIDKSELQTALRETEEEVGVSANKIEILGPLSELYIPVSKFMVYPFIGYSREIPSYERQVSEVAEIFHFSLKRLTSKDAVTFERIKANDNVVLTNIPAFKHGEKIIWGATALIMNELREILLRENFKIEL